MRLLFDLAKKAFRAVPCKETCDIYRAVAITAAQDGIEMDWRKIDNETRPYWTLLPSAPSA